MPTIQDAEDNLPKDLLTEISGQTEEQAEEKGFTLIELSIVLVIIGLIVGGVLVGQDLIKAAEVRATVGQIEKYNSAVNTFQGKYTGIPGDLSTDKASAFGFTSRNGGAGRGDGNGLIDSTVNGQAFGQESAMFWNDLSVANLIDGNFTTAFNQDAATPANAAIPATNVALAMPAARIGRGNYVTVGSLSSINYWLIAGITGVTITTGAYSTTENLTPNEAYNMDVKLDDGMPETGIVQAHGNSTSTTAIFYDASAWSTATYTSAAVGDCVTTGANGSDPTDTYNRTKATGGNSPACILRFRFN